MYRFYSRKERIRRKYFRIWLTRVKSSGQVFFRLTNATILSEKKTKREWVNCWIRNRTTAVKIDDSRWLHRNFDNGTSAANRHCSPSERTRWVSRGLPEKDMDWIIRTYLNLLSRAIGQVFDRKDLPIRNYSIEYQGKTSRIYELSGNCFERIRRTTGIIWPSF